MRQFKMNELTSLMFAAYVWFTLTVAPNFFEDAIANNPDSLYVGYIAMVGSQQNLAWISLAVAAIVFGSFFIRNYNARILVNCISIVYFTFIAASYVFNYPNLALGLLLVVVVWHIYETNRLINKSEDEKSKRILQQSLNSEDYLEKEEIENEARKRTEDSE